MGRHLTLREALASGQLADFVRQAEARGVELASGSDFERALALLITQRRSEATSRCEFRACARWRECDAGETRYCDLFGLHRCWAQTRPAIIPYPREVAPPCSYDSGESSRKSGEARAKP